LRGYLARLRWSDPAGHFQGDHRPKFAFSPQPTPSYCTLGGIISCWAVTGKIQKYILRGKGGCASESHKANLGCLISQSRDSFLLPRRERAGRPADWLNVM
jgi:hypothetical protein